jgi:hypothetical protein
MNERIENRIRELKEKMEEFLNGNTEVNENYITSVELSFRTKDGERYAAGIAIEDTVFNKQGAQNGN